MSNEINKLASEVSESAMSSLIKARASFTPAQKGGVTGVLVGAGIGGAVGGAIGAAGGFLWQHKGKVALVAAAAVAFAYREEIGDFIGDKLSGESAGGDAFM